MNFEDLLSETGEDLSVIIIDRLLVLLLLSDCRHEQVNC